MTTINPGGIGPLQLATGQAAASSQQKVASTERTSTDTARAIFKADQLDLAAEKVGDVGTASETSDRDADGRQAWTILHRRGPDDEQQENPADPGSSLDPDDEAQSHFIADA